MYLNKPDSALLDYNMAIKIDPNKSNSFLNSGMAKYLLKNQSDAYKDWQKSSNMNNKEAREYLLKYCPK